MNADQPAGADGSSGTAPEPRARTPRRIRSARSALAARRPALVGLLFWVVVPVLCLYALFIGIRQITTNVHNEVPGITGTFRAESHNCQQQLCITSGTFASDDGLLIEPDLMGDYRWPVGSTSRAVYNARSGEVTGVADTWDVTPTIVGMLGAVVFLGLWGYLLVLTRRRLARDRAAAGPPGPIRPPVAALFSASPDAGPSIG